MKAWFLVAALLLSQTLVVQAVSNRSEYAEVTAFVNGQKVPPIYTTKLKVSEPFDVEIVVELKKDANFGLALSSPGDPDDKPSYAAESGPVPFGKTLDIEGPREGGRVQPRKAGEQFDLKWRLKPTSAWTGGSAPITLDASFTPPGKSIGDTVTFTIASIYIEPSGGAVPPTPAATPRQPGFEAALAVPALLLVLLFAGRSRRRRGPWSGPGKPSGTRGRF